MREAELLEDEVEPEVELFEDEKDYDGAIKRDPKEGIWITREGDPLHISEMEDEHVVMARRFLIVWRRGEKRAYKKKDLNAWISEFARELKRRGVKVEW